jgi:hypothetical protein
LDKIVIAYGGNKIGIAILVIFSILVPVVFFFTFFLVLKYKYKTLGTRFHAACGPQNALIRR